MYYDCEYCFVRPFPKEFFPLTGDTFLHKAKSIVTNINWLTNKNQAL